MTPTFLTAAFSHSSCNPNRNAHACTHTHSYHIGLIHTKHRTQQVMSGLKMVMRVSPQLAKVVGESEMPRTEVVKRIWAYIKTKDLQNPSNKREIMCDDSLKAVFERPAVSMFEMHKLLTKHLSKP